MYTATEAGIRSVAGNFNVIKVPKFFLAFQVARIKSAQGTLGTAPGVQVEHLLGKGMSLFSFFYSLTTASWGMTMMLRECSVVMKWLSERERESTSGNLLGNTSRQESLMRNMLISCV